MATHRINIESAVQADMGDRSFDRPLGAGQQESRDAVPPVTAASGGGQKSVRVRMDSADFSMLQKMAKAEGTNASALIRQMVKRAIKS